ncbi:MAG TPA: hypothetical protein VMT46_03920 [Anaerolineaceae bacterium]|nr:hypothetical protein [Anaerolineaceae bacterium]
MIFLGIILFRKGTGKMEIYRWVILLHVLFAFGFFLSHGASALAMFKLRNERSHERICAIIELCKMGEPPMIISFLGILITGIAGGFIGGWWRHGWIWAALILLIAIDLLMGRYGRVYIEQIANALGMVDARATKKGVIPAQPASPEALATIVNAGRPGLMASVGLGGLAAIILLMTIKPF